MADAHKNFATSLVATAPSPATSGTSLVITGGDGTKFPNAPFNATIWPVGVQPTTANAEIVRVTAVSTDTFTIVRQQESTSARTVIVGDQIAATITAKTLTDAENPLAGVVGGSLTASTDFVAVDTLEVSATDTLEMPATSTVEIEPILRAPNLRADRFYNPVKFSVYRSAAQNSTATTAVVVLCDTKVYDTGSNVDIVTNKGRFTAPADGWYHFSGRTDATTTRLFTALAKNGAEYTRGVDSTVASSVIASVVTGEIYLLAGEYVELTVWAQGTTALSVGQVTSYFQGYLVSAT